MFQRVQTSLNMEPIFHDEDELTALQRAFFWCGFLIPLPSICLSLFLPGGTVEYFGGNPTSTAKFWCSLTASGDIVISILCWFVLSNPKNLPLRRAVLTALAFYALLYFGMIAKAHFTVDPVPGGPVPYILGVLVTWAAFAVWGLP